MLSFPAIAIFLVYSRDLRESTQEVNLMSSAAIAAVRETVAKLKQHNVLHYAHNSFHFKRKSIEFYFKDY